MSFSPEWLALREPADIRARNADVLKAVAAHCANKPAPKIADLACGTGSTFRAISAALPGSQRWTLYDFDAALLEEARRLLPEVPIETIEIDLLKDLPRVFAPEPDLIVTSAFLDLVSAEWLDQLIGACARHGTPFYAALSYDGRASCDPPHRDDRAIIDAVNRHQRTDKGFGPALGPDAAAYAIRALEKPGLMWCRASPIGCSCHRRASWPR